MTACCRCLDEATVASYWGHALCRPCARAAADYFDRIGHWPPLPVEWQTELDALGAWPTNRHGQPLGVEYVRLVDVDTMTHPQPLPETCPPNVTPTADHPWVPCTECGAGCLTSLTNPNGKPRDVWPPCRFTPRCDGRHDPNLKVAPQ